MKTKTVTVIERKILWDKNLYGPALGSTQNMNVDANGHLAVYYPDGIFR